MNRTATLADLAALVGGEVRGDGSRLVAGVGSLLSAEAAELALWASARWRSEALESRAGAFLVAPDLVDSLDRPAIVHPHPAVAMTRVSEHFHPRPAAVAGVHPSAVLDPAAQVHASAEVGPFVVVGAGSTVASGVRIGAGVVIGRNCVVGRDSVLHPRVVLYDQVTLGERVEVHAGAVLGADGFGYVHDGRAFRKVPQLGGLEVGDDVEIGANTTVDRATFDMTSIGSGTKLDNLVQVGHNARIGAGSLLCGQVGIAGSSRLGSGVVLGGRSGVADHVEIADGIQVAGGSVVYQSCTEPGMKLGGYPAVELSLWHRQRVWLQRLGELFGRVRRLEQPGSEEKS